ncbi:ATP-binding cassette domain-containing protein [Pelotomaculum terephthalicicum JT]|uniref:ATP-binding cassette domain-containing protein n=1 Tax=Pelotomaculum TaxID=191373 RepID=UPI0009CB4D67|nr:MULTISPECIES: ATP-binding cassette domain-containing protein [Pelotomaculum]MCG9968817.1 ATP-binding cassette domain-containing protein [Pelotomaculum terephthalicicum JT]OPX89766.1 MAG: Energy-coupling factor transporter ATP-binding protein EcfA2 [Pelotomaculum sp. PtaB.Bin117]OPY63470.1 MAG: Energy-coupling factor transporter ATP-binding protein EcfA2 [Pelotomaculum sp. PtaU1.Bin065]
MPVIEINNLSYAYNGGTPDEKKVLDNITLSVEKGEFLGIIGANGSGKSTLIQHFNGLLYPQSGSISVLGFDTRDKHYGSQLWKYVGMVFQFPEQQIFEATVYDELAYGLSNMELDRAEIEVRVDEALANVGLVPEQVRAVSPLCLSGGMRRRIAIASILAMKPDILVLDEPMAGLDPEGCAHILAAIKRYRQEQDVTVIMVSHYINELIVLSDRVALLDNGRLRAWGPARELLARDDLPNYDLLLPDYLKLLHNLKKRGLKVKTGVLTVEEAAGEIGRVLERIKC